MIDRTRRNVVGPSEVEQPDVIISFTTQVTYRTLSYDEETGRIPNQCSFRALYGLLGFKQADPTDSGIFLLVSRCFSRFITF